MKPEITFDGPRMRIRYLGKPTRLVVYNIPLARDREFKTVRLILPEDLTTAEAERLQRIIGTLVMPPEIIAEAAA